MTTNSQATPPERSELTPVSDKHFVNGNPLCGPFPQHLAQAVFGMGCFGGVERLFWKLEGVYTTAVGYAGGHTPSPDYEAVCSGTTGHVEVVLVVFDPAVVDFEQLLTCFWEGHNPTQGMRQGHDVGTQYRSAIYTSDEVQNRLAEASRISYQRALHREGYGEITTEIIPAPKFFYAEDYHQQYLAKNIGGYCGLGGTGISCPTEPLLRAD